MIHPAWHFAWCTLHRNQISRVTIYTLDVFLSWYGTTPLCYSMSSSNCCFLSCTQVSQEAGKVVWYSPLFKNFPQFVVIHIIKGFSVVNETDFFFNSLAFSMIRWMLAIWSLVPLPFLNPAWMSRSSQFTYFLKSNLEDFEH